MGQSMYWKPVVQASEGVDERLKMILRKRFGVDAFPVKLDHGMLDYLSGLADGGVEDAKTLIGAIAKHGSIELELR